MGMVDAKRDKADPRLSDETLMRAFAREWLRRPDMPVACAMKLFPLPEDCGVAAIASQLWARDPFVIEEKRRLLALNDGIVVPTRDQAAALAYEIAEDNKRPASERLAALRLFADMNGYITKSPASQINVGGIGANSVMIVKDKGNEEEWSAGLVQQQRDLVSDVNSDTAADAG